jgi:hypothetical protein
MNLGVWQYAPTVFAQKSRPAQKETRDDSIYASKGARRPEIRWIMDTPTAGMLPRGSFDLDMRTFSQGGLQATLGIGLMDRFSVGIGYGAASVLTDTMPDYNPRLEFELKFRLLEESPELPAFAVGFSSQGYGPYDSDKKRYMVKSPGFYGAFSKNFKIYSNPAGLHGGVNYSLENEKDSDPDVFIGFNADLGADMMYLAEYDLALNDNKRDGDYGLGRGYLNMGLVWYMTDDLSLEFDLRNLLRNRRDASAIDREARLVYVEFFY